MPLPTITIKKTKNGKVVAWFRDGAGRRVGTSTSVSGGGWVKAEQVKQVAEYGIQLQLEQLDSGLGSDGGPMPPLQGAGKPTFVGRVNGRAVFERRGYAADKVKVGLQPKRDLLGPGKGGHMRDDMRINYLDDNQAKISITSRLGRIKAAANERRAAWWGWSPASAVKLAAMAEVVYGLATADHLVAMGLVAGDALGRLRARALRRAA